MNTKVKDLNNINESKPLSSPLEILFDKRRGSFKKLLNKISVGIIILNFKKREIKFVNKYFYTVTPKQKQEEVINTIFNYIEKNIRLQKKFNISQHVVIKTDGKEILYSFTPYCIDEEECFVLLNEVTSGAQYSLSKQENMYYTRLSDLIAEMVHEIGNPLSGIKTSLHILLQNLSCWPPEKVQNYIERTINEINRLSEFLSRMREVSDENKLNIKPTNLKLCLDRVLLQAEGLIHQKGLIYKNMIEDNISVLIDEGAFHQIMFNLVNNSLKILSPGEKIKLYVEEIDEFYVRLIYRNNGKPIPEELIDKIFSPLYTTKVRNKGIGLAISLKLMTRMGGTIKVVIPEDGIGAKFVLFVPNYTQNSKKKDKK